MRVLQNFERRLQGAVGNTFARLFGGKVQPAEVADALQKEAAEHVQRQGSASIAPNHYRVRLGPTDRQGLGSDEESVASALSDMIREYLDEQGWQTFGDVAVSLEQSESLHTGQFRISSIVDPDVGRRSPHQGAGEGRMTQQPGDPGRPDTRQPDNRPPDNRGEPPRGHDPRDGQQYVPPGYGGPGPSGPPDQNQGYQGPNQGYPPQPYDAPGYGQRVWDQQGQQWEQQYGQQQPYQQGYPQQPYQQGPQQPWDQQGYQQGYPQQGQQSGYPQNYGQNYGVPAAAPQEITATLSIDDGSGRSHQLQRGSNVIGRGQDAAFRLADTSVSRRHVDVYFDGQSAVLHDLGSTNGTTVNGSSVQTWQLADGDVIHIGHSTVVFASRY